MTLFFLSLFPVIAMIIEIKKKYELRGIYNFRKDFKATRKMKNKRPDNYEGIRLGDTMNHKPLFLPDNLKHFFICGTTGAGKTVALSNFIQYACVEDLPLLIVDGKGDMGQGSILEITKKFAKRSFRDLYIVNLNCPAESSKYNPFQNTEPSVIKDMLINMSEWTEEHYKLNTERYLQRVIQLLSKFDCTLNLRSIIKAMNPEAFTRGSAELLKLEVISKEQHLDNIALAKSSGKIAEDSIARFATIAESGVGQIFHKDGIDIYTALKENAIILFVLNPLLYPELSPAIGRLVLIDSKKAVSKLFGDKRRKLFLFDEISNYASPSIVDLVNKSRSANVTCTLATQTLSDLDIISEHLKQQVIENCNNYLVMRQNSSDNAEHWAGILGTRNSMEVTYQLQQRGLNTATTGFGSARRVREFLYHPDTIKHLPVGQGIFMSKDLPYHAKIKVHKPF